MKKTIILMFYYEKLNQHYDIEVPLDITANELIFGLNKGLNLGLNLERIEECYLCTDAPMTLLRGNSLLEEFHLRDGTMIHFQR